MEFQRLAMSTLTLHGDNIIENGASEDVSGLPGTPVQVKGEQTAKSESIASLQARVEKIEATISKLSKIPFATSVDSIEAGKSKTVIKQELATNDLAGDVKVVYKNVNATMSGSTKEEEGSPPTSQDTSSPTRGKALIFYTHYNKEGKFDKVKVQIKSNELVNLMRKTMGKMIMHEGVSSVWKEAPITVDLPSVLITHCLGDLHAAAAADDSDDGKSAMKELACFLRHLDFFEAELWKDRETIREAQEVKWGSIWTLFIPGTQIVAKPFQEQDQLFVVHRHGRDKDFFIITCWCYDWDGSSLVRHYYDFKIAKYLGTKRITDLECYPVQYYAQNGGGEEVLRAKLIERGKRMRTFCTPALSKEAPRLYQSSVFFGAEKLEADVLQKSFQDLFKLNFNRFKEVKAEQGLPLDVVVDAELCRRYAWQSYEYLGNVPLKAKAPCECSLCDLGGRRGPFEKAFTESTATSTTATVAKTTTTASNSEELFALLTPRLHGYNVTYKMWGQMNVDNVEIEKPSPDRTVQDPWDELTLEAEHKNNLKALVTSHFDRVAQERSEQDVHINIQDLVARKGDGVVILLHGIPGVGKTMTAETLAKSLRRRLLRIDASDFEHNSPAQVSSVFKQYFHMATSWGSLLLLDEADVFLQVRKRAEQNQNALVSILLRELEYFQGVLIMTTNRIVSVDYAVQSRIHYAIRFNELHIPQIERIWRTFRRQLNEGNCTESEQAKIDAWFDIAKNQLKNSKFTGRDIRNVFIIAQLLGYPAITKDNIEKAVNQTQSFRNDLEIISRKAAQQNAILDD